ncbi:hypothetical protein MUK70_11880 [Dyadobacter chenwenxiniae]|uniref:Uncharacterized protein n=1 Tax=Dyadobacter chenwenxiniae TaxID=2906456 RepID=A0A9X1PG33_9BACT|nr:hypothetical protein [Dyadobacter chenwenxiniae]MCF0059941.1 hypothetical protein [Dyadobacter chenwenxiniae]UON85680.1 hypothetical protein MUK70_11880 [Dyadobacter chenwenxiniae]
MVEVEVTRAFRDVDSLDMREPKTIIKVSEARAKGLIENGFAKEVKAEKAEAKVPEAEEKESKEVISTKEEKAKPATKARP